MSDPHLLDLAGMESQHEGDCLGTLCPSCGCCLHCLDVGCGCEGCVDHTCGCNLLALTEGRS